MTTRGHHGLLLAGGDSATVSLLHFDGSNGSTTFTDQTGKTWAPSGNAQISTAQSMFGGASGLFDGSGDFISTPSHADFNFGAGNFTIECWVRPTNFGNYRVIAAKRASGSVVAPFCIQFNTGGNNSRLFVSFSLNGSTWALQLSSGTSMSSATWYHVAVVRNGTTVTVYQNGVSVASGTLTGELMTNANAVTVGADGDGATGFNGYIDEMRVSKGVARYTAAFTPPSAPFPNP